MTWNYRLVHYKDGNGKGEDYYRIQEVYYNEDDSIYLYNEGAIVGGSTIKEAKKVHKMLAEAFRAPILESTDLPTPEDVDRMDEEMDKEAESRIHPPFDSIMTQAEEDEYEWNDPDLYGY
jgi:hypothetical protein